MSENNKTKLTPSAMSASGKLRSPVTSTKVKGGKKPAKPSIKPKIRKPKLAAGSTSAKFTIVTAEDDRAEMITVAKKAVPQATPYGVKVKAPTPPRISNIASVASKETLYIDVDDEITVIIEKLQQAKGNIVALVLPKRAVVMQSIVNMRLLKRTAEQAGKRLVLVTNEAGLLPLAGLVGLYISATPSSKPIIPPTPDQPSDEPESVDESLELIDESSADDGFDAKLAANTPVGELAGITAASPSDVDDEVLLDVEPEKLASETLASEEPIMKNKKLVIPDFNKFRLYAFLGVLSLILLIIGLIVATKVMPRASVQIKTDSQVVSSTLNLTLDTTAKTVDAANKIIPAVAQTSPKSASQQVSATGQQNNGVKASGAVKFTVTMCAPNLDAPDDIPTGSSVTSNGKTYITQESGGYSLSGASGSCVKYATNSIDISGLKAGTEYNLSSGSTFSGPGGASGTGSANGGTDIIVKIVTQSDIDGAKAKLAAQDTAQLKQDLTAALQGKGLLPIPSTFIAGDQQVTTSAQAGATADTVTVSLTTPYTMLGIKQSDLRPLIVDEVKKQIDPDKQQILDDGVSQTVFTQQSPGSPANAVVTAKAKSIAGPELRAGEIKRQVAGKKAGEIKMELGSLPGVTDVQVKYSPFWVTVAPKDSKKVTVEIAEPTVNNGK